MSKSPTSVVRIVQAGPTRPVDPLGLADEIGEEIWAANRAARTSLDHAIRAGEKLLRAKNQLAHGEWLPWLEKYLPDVEESTAQLYIRVYEYRRRLRGMDLPLREAKRLIAGRRGIVTRSGNDKVMTPAELCAAIARAAKPSGTILEPCAGNGDFVRALKKYGKVLECEIDRGQNFFNWSQPVDWIVTNPPWSRFSRFLGRCMKLAPDIVLLVTVNHFWTTRRVRDVRKAGFGYKTLWLIDEYPKDFVRTGFQLGAMHLRKGWKGPLTVRPLPKIKP